MSQQLNYQDCLDELVRWNEDISSFVYYLKNLDFEFHENTQYHARNDMLMMIGLFHDYLQKLHREATVCRQRKKTTPVFEKLYHRAAEYKNTVESNRVMYSLMFA